MDGNSETGTRVTKNWLVNKQGSTNYSTNFLGIKQYTCHMYGNLRDFAHNSALFGLVI